MWGGCGVRRAHQEVAVRAGVLDGRRVLGGRLEGGYLSGCCGEGGEGIGGA